MNRENGMLCLVFPMGMELHPFLHRVEIRSRWTSGKATYRQVFFEGVQLLTIRSGIGPARAEAAIRNLPTGAMGIVSVGTAGALVEDLRVGDIIVGSETLSEAALDRACACSPELVEALARACGTEGREFRIGRIVTTANAVFHRRERERLHEVSGALAVDMESHSIVQVAEELGLPCACLRVISDDIRSRGLPDRHILKRIRRNPALLPSLIVALIQMRQFLKRFRWAIDVLPPILIRLIRDSNQRL